MAILIFWTRFAQKGYFGSKAETVNTTIEFCIFELVEALKFQLRLTILIFWINFTQKGYLSSKTERLHFCVHTWSLLTIWTFLQRDRQTQQKITLYFTGYASGTWLSDCSKLTLNWQNDNDVTICRHDVIVNFFFDVILFFLSSLVQVSCQYHHWFWSYDSLLL